MTRGPLSVYVCMDDAIDHRSQFNQGGRGRCDVGKKQLRLVRISTSRFSWRRRRPPIPRALWTGPWPCLGPWRHPLGERNFKHGPHFFCAGNRLRINGGGTRASKQDKSDRSGRACDGSRVGALQPAQGLPQSLEGGEWWPGAGNRRAAPDKSPRTSRSLKKASPASRHPPTPPKKEMELSKDRKAEASRR